MMETNLTVAKFRLNLYELESVLSMSSIYSISQEDLIERLNTINLKMAEADREEGLDLTSCFNEMDRVKAAFANNKIEIYTVK